MKYSPSVRPSKRVSLAHERGGVCDPFDKLHG